MKIVLAGRMTGLWLSAVELARQVYADQYGADVMPSPDSFITALGPGADKQMLACAGLTFGGDGTLFSERYLDRCLEEEFDRHLGVRVERQSVVEVGALASRQRAVGLEVIRATPIIAWCLGMQYILCTATKPLIKTLDKTGIGFVPFGTADPARLGSPEEVGRWGTYYDQEPQVGVIPLNALQRLFSETTGRYIFTDMELSLSGSREVVTHAGH